MTSSLLCLSLLAAAPTAPSAKADAEVAAVRAAVQRALPYLVERGQWWIDEKKCITCHRIGVAVWGMNEAALRGFDVDRKVLDDWTKFSLTSSAKQDDKGIADGTKNPEGVAQLLLGASIGADDHEARKTLVGYLVGSQNGDGSWKAGGQLPDQKRPAEETTAVSTMWDALALSAQEAADVATAREKALAWTDADKRVTAAKSTEWFVVRLLSARRRGAADVERWKDELLKLQRDDGGWGWLVADESDALATGMALYALAEIGGEDRAVRRAWEFLATTQNDDGSWAVKGTKTGKKDKVEETASYWGTAWAVLGVARSLPK